MAAMSDTGASQRDRAEERSAWGGAMSRRGEPDGSANSGGGNRRPGRLGEVWAGSGRSGPAWTGLDRPGPDRLA